jgi:Ca2+-binding RTX toxin-like protein
VGGGFVSPAVTPDPVNMATPDPGIDTVQSSVSISILPGVENLTLTGTGNIFGTGNSGANVIIGNAGNNVIRGMTGADTLTGGGGTDTFSFIAYTGGMSTVTDFVQGVDSLEIFAAAFGGGLVAGGAATIVHAAAAGTASNAGTAGYFIVDNSGADAGTILWDRTGGSGSDAIAFAKLDGITSLLPSDFDIV